MLVEYNDLEVRLYPPEQSLTIIYINEDQNSFRLFAGRELVSELLEVINP